MTIAEYLATFLKNSGVQTVFGLPGGENVPVVEALRQAGIGLTLMHHEISAAFAADVLGQLTDSPGVCLSTVGPGAVNLAAGATAATRERSPVLAITAEIAASWLPNVTHMKVDLTALFGQTKGSHHLTPDNTPATLAASWQLAQQVPRGAVHVAVDPETAVLPLTTPIALPNPPEPEPFDPVMLEAALPYLREAKRPFLLAGVGVEAAGAQPELLALAEAWQIPVAVTPKAKGHFPENHPLFAGVFTAYGDKALRQALNEADLVVGVGLDSVDFVTSTWNSPAPVLNLAEAEADDPALRPVVAVNGRLSPLLTHLQTIRQPHSDGVARAADIRQQIAAALVTPYPDTPGCLKLHDLIAALRRALPEETAVTVDVGAFKLVFLQQWRTNTPKSVFVANGLSAMGYAIPGAIAIRTAQLHRPVVAIAGDGALLMYAGELATVARLQQPLIILVVVDEALSLIRLKQLRQEVTIHATEFGYTNYEALAAAFGLSYRLVDNVATAEETLREAAGLTHPVLVEARVNKVEYEHFR
ncbi:MAG: thiamine pyrophosphate-binding protein [Anaerolineales bacterium]|nr:thiamine pyrophosphate-binding protein [Anaerolineales bacterium]